MKGQTIHARAWTRRTAHPACKPYPSEGTTATDLAKVTCRLCQMQLAAEIRRAGA